MVERHRGPRAPEVDARLRGWGAQVRDLPEAEQELRPERRHDRDQERGDGKSQHRENQTPSAARGPRPRAPGEESEGGDPRDGRNPGAA